MRKWNLLSEEPSIPGKPKYSIMTRVPCHGMDDVGSPLKRKIVRASSKILGSQTHTINLLLLPSLARTDSG